MQFVTWNIDEQSENRALQSFYRLNSDTNFTHKQSSLHGRSPRHKHRCDNDVVSNNSDTVTITSKVLVAHSEKDDSSSVQSSL